MQQKTFTKTQKKNMREYIKCAGSFSYFVNSQCVIQDRTGHKPIPFKLWPGQERVVPTMTTSKKVIILKARQLGLTWLTAAYCLWRAIFSYNALVVVVSGSREETAIEFLDRVKFIFDSLPEWMKPTVKTRNLKELHFGIEGLGADKGLNSVIKSVPSTPDAGQGKTISLLVMDESALNRYCKEIYSAAKPTLEHAEGQLVVISNPSKDKPGWSWTRDIYTGSMRGDNDFDRIFLNWECVPGREDGFVAQLRRDGFDDDDIAMQYPTTEEEAISALLGSYFGTVLARHTKAQPGKRGILETDKDETVTFKEEEHGILEIWDDHYTKEPDWDGLHWEGRYAIGSDISEGLGLSHSVGYVYDRLNDSFVARISSNKIDAHEWATKLWHLANYYHNNNEACLLCPERNGAGQTTVKKLRDIGARLYMKKSADSAGNIIQKQYGWHESEQAKHELCGDLKAFLRHTKSTIYCGTLIDQCSTFIRHETGKLKHEDGKMDDYVFGAGLSLQAGYFSAHPPLQVGKRERVIRRKQEKVEGLGGVSSAAWQEVNHLWDEIEKENERELSLDWY
jgi:hypothetical protein